MDTEKRYTNVITLSVLCIFLLIVSSCSGQADSSHRQSILTTPELTNPGYGSGSYITANSISELTKKSTQIVIGQVTKAVGIINMARDINDITKADSDVFVIGQVYQFRVDKYIKGEGDQVINIVQREGFLGASSSKTEVDIEKARSLEKYIPIDEKTNYLLFLEPLLGFSDGKYYVGVAHPWRFNLNNPESVVPESPWEGASQLFLSQSLDSLIYQIEHPESIPTPINPRTGEGYPAPTTTPYP
jgi:hypothetical protein